MSTRPGEGPGRDLIGPRPRPNQEEPPWRVRFRIRSFSLRREGFYANHRRQPFGPVRGSSTRIYLPDALDLLEQLYNVVELGSRRESPAAPCAARYVEVGGRGGNGRRHRRPRPRGRLTTTGGCGPRQVGRCVCFAPGRPRCTGTCLLRRLSGSTPPMLGGLVSDTAESGVRR